MSKTTFGIAILGFSVRLATGGVGDVQTRTDHPWYPGEFSASNWERLFATQAEQYTRETGRAVDNDEDKALASWYWRNRNVFHTTEAGQDLFGRGWGQGDQTTREYWTGLFAMGFGLCFDVHHQYAGEMIALLGPNRSRSVEVPGHQTFEVWLTGGAYDAGRWALLDHDTSTVVFKADGSRLVGLMEIVQDQSLVAQSDLSRGWMPAGFHPSHRNSYRSPGWIGYDTGFAGVPPKVHLRAGETLRRYPRPGLEDGETFVYWGRNMNKDGIPGPARNRAWVNQPQNMYRSQSGSGWIVGQARYGNAVYTYRPDFAGGGYREGVIDESDGQVTFEFHTPYIIGATPPPASASEAFGIYKEGASNGLVINGRIACPIEVSVDRGATWTAFEGRDGLDLTDAVKGYRQYWLRFRAGAGELAGSGLSIRTVCMSSSSMVPRVREGANRVTYYAGGRGVVSAGPTVPQAAAHIVDGALESPTVTLELEPPRGARAMAVHAAARVSSYNPPRPSKYTIEVSTDGGGEWTPILKDWEIVRRPPETGRFWSQTFNSGSGELPGVTGPVRARFRNTANLPYRRVEMHLVYEIENSSPLTVTHAWKENGATRTARREYPPAPAGHVDASWSFEAGSGAETFWVEYETP